MSDDILLIGDGVFDIEASAPEGRKPRIICAPAYSGGKLDVAWKNPETGEHLPVVVDIASLKTEEGLPFVRHHNGNEPLGTIEKITKTNSELCAEGSFTHGHTYYGATELIAARNGFKHRPSVTVYRPDPKDVIRVGAGEKRFINDRYHEGACFAIYNGRLKDISLVTSPGDPDGGKGTILAHSQGVQTMSEPNLLPDPPEPANVTPASSAITPLEIQATANQTPPAPPATPTVNVMPSVPPDHREYISMLYNRGDLSAEIMAQAYDQNWSPKQALDAQSKVSGLTQGVNNKPNIPGFPHQSNAKRDEPNADMIMAAAFLMENCGFKPDDFDGKKNRDAVLRLDEKTIDAATSGEYRGMRFSDLCAHAAETFYAGKTLSRRRLHSYKPMEYFEASVQAQEEIDRKLIFNDSADIRADADTGLSTIGLKNIWALINTATIGKAYQEVPTIWQRICKKASVSNFLKHTVHRTKLVGRYERLDRIGGEPPHATYMEDQTEAQIESWGIMLTLSRKDIINDEVGVFRDAAADLGREAARTLERECFAALLTDGAQLFTTPHGNYLAGNDSAFSFESLDKAHNMFWQQKGMDGELIMVRPSFLLIPTCRFMSISRLLSMGTMDGSPLGAKTGYQNFPIIDTPYLQTNNGLYVNEGSKRKMVPGNDDGWYLFANPTDMPVIVATFLNGKTSPTIQRANMRFSLDGIQYKATLDFEFNTSEYRGGVYFKGKA